MSEAALERMPGFGRLTALAYSGSRVAHEHQTDRKFPSKVESGRRLILLAEDLHPEIERIHNHLPMVVADEATATKPMNRYFPTENPQPYTNFNLPAFSNGNN